METEILEQKSGIIKRLKGSILSSQKAAQFGEQMSLSFENKVRSFNSIRPYRDTQAMRVLSHYDLKTAQTDPEISERSNLPLHVICARRNELVKKGYVIELCSKFNQSTGKQNTAYVLTSKGYKVLYARN
jgi:hypothetical protein